MTATSTHNGGHVVVGVLERYGVRHVFGQDSPEWLYEALDPERIRAVTMRDERSAGFATDTVARLTGSPAVACGIHGPGALNLMTALLEAQAACLPLMALTSGIETDVYGTGAFQEVDQVAVARPVAPEDVIVCDAAYSSVWALSYLQQGRHFDRITYGRAAGTLGFGLQGRSAPPLRSRTGASSHSSAMAASALAGASSRHSPASGCASSASSSTTTATRIRSSGTTSMTARHAGLTSPMCATTGSSRRSASPACVWRKPVSSSSPALREAFALGEPCVVNVRIQPGALSPFNFDRHRRR